MSKQNISQSKFNKPIESQTEEYLYGRNPVIEALRANRNIESILIADSAIGSVSVIKALASENGVVVKTVPRAKLDALVPQSNHQGVLAFCYSFEYQDIDAILRYARSRGEKPLIVILDQIMDPHNLGAIIRSAECAGFHGVIIQNRRAASVNSTVAKSSAGAIESIPVARVNNLSQCIEKLKDQGVWIAAATMDGESYLKHDLTGPLGLIIGNEGQGVSHGLLNHADFTLSIPMYGKINSLNASSAASVLLFAIRAANQSN